VEEGVMILSIKGNKIRRFFATSIFLSRLGGCLAMLVIVRA
jgi:hypothetical protein